MGGTLGGPQGDGGRVGNSIGCIGVCIGVSVSNMYSMWRYVERRVVYMYRSLGICVPSCCNS